MSALTLVVRSNRRATPSTRILQIDLRGAPFAFEAGQWAALAVGDAAGQPYSIACSPRQSREGDFLEFLIRVEGSGVALAALRRGTAVRVDGPHGRFRLPHPFRASHALLVAGGTGIAPLRSMLHELLARPAPPHCSLVYSTRARNEFAYLPELRALARQHQLRLALAVTRDLRAGWKGLSGRIGRAQLAELLASPDTPCFVCGPDGFVRDVREALEELGARWVRAEGQ